METKDSVSIGGHNCEIRTFWADSDREKSYEVWLDGKMAGQRNPWPIHPSDRPRGGQLLTAEELFDNLKKMYGKTFME
jgi:hypothetical protein